jgi:hypothetical protein
MKEETTRPTVDRDEFKRLEERTRIALARAVARAAEYASTVGGKRRRRRVRHDRQIRSTK